LFRVNTQLAPDSTDLPEWLSRLNEPQREAVLSTDGPVLMLAGAGTGKTAALTARLAWLLRQRLAWPSEILCVTFTNKAAREMRERVGHLIGPAVEGMPWLGTFHAIAAKMLRRHAELVGLTSNFTILDTDDQLRLLKQLIQAEGVDDKRWPARQLAGLIDRWKNRGLNPADLDALENEAYANGRGQRFYALYQDRLRSINACDFGDLLLHMLNIFRRERDVLEQYQQRFRYVMVDEYQDTNAVQYLWLRLWPKVAATSVSWATTISRSIPGAARKSPTSCASKRIFPAQRSFASNRTIARRPISWVQPRA
jgi:DNA helicase-2/ATP-dependent DNA helicase PcrA